MDPWYIVKHCPENGILFWDRERNQWRIHRELVRPYHGSRAVHAAATRKSKSIRNRIFGHKFGTIAESKIQKYERDHGDAWRAYISFHLFA